jgi:hypothetical protein
MKKGQSIRVHYKGHGKSGGRVQYDPDGSPTFPYKTFFQGTAGACFTSELRARLHLAPNPNAHWSKPS